MDRDESSIRLSLLRFSLIIGVVFIHAYGASVGFAGNSIGTSQSSAGANFIVNFIS
jgi:hypothetical protein